MFRQRLYGWNLAYLALMAIGYIAAVVHVTGERYGNAAMAAGAATLGVIIFLTDRTMGERRPARPRAPRAQRAVRPERPPAPADGCPNERWLSGAILAGFVATIVMSLLLVMAYTVIGFIGDENGGQLSRWFWALSHNELTTGVYDIPIAAFSVNLLAGLGWALVYAAFVEPRLSGPGWRRGITFAIVPWLLSLVVFFPAVGGGVFGEGLGAGPLPAIGNLLLHLIYGAVLGGVYAIPEVSERASAADARTAKLETDGVAYGLVAGLTAGIVVGAIVSAILADNVKDGLNLTLIAGGLGTVIGGVVGPFLGLDWDTHHEPG